MFNQVAPTYPPDDVRFVGVVYQSEDSQVSEFLDRVGRNIPTLRDADGIASIDFGVTGVPETFVVDRDGIVRYRVAGPVTQAKLTELLGHAARRRRPPERPVTGWPRPARRGRP